MKLFLLNATHNPSDFHVIRHAHNTLTCF